MCYEGIHKLCFGCGRIGHGKEQCSYAIRQPSLSRMTVNQPEGEIGVQACNMHDPENDKQNVGPILNVHDSAQEDVLESTYGPWVVIMRKNQGTKHQRRDGTPLNMGHGQAQSRKETRSNMLPRSTKTSSGSSRDAKRKLSS